MTLCCTPISLSRRSIVSTPGRSLSFSEIEHQRRVFQGHYASHPVTKRSQSRLDSLSKGSARCGKSAGRWARPGIARDWTLGGIGVPGDVVREVYHRVSRRKATMQPKRSRNTPSSDWPR